LQFIGECGLNRLAATPEPAPNNELVDPFDEVRIERQRYFGLGHCRYDDLSYQPDTRSNKALEPSAPAIERAATQRQG
jgi:hypothetical protein